MLIMGMIHFSSAKEIDDKIAHQNYRWDDTTSVTISPYDSLYDVVFVKDYTVKEWHESSTFKGEYLSFRTLFLFTTIHKRIKLNNDQGVNDYNKMYLPVLSNEEIFEIHARAINPDGTIINFNESSIKEIDDLEGYGPYKIFAFEGVQVGSELEYYYTVKSVENDKYGSLDVQREVPILDYGFQLIFPKAYTFDCKSYNGLDSLRADSISETSHGLRLNGVFVEAFESEFFSLGDALKQRIEYKVATDELEGMEVYTWQKAADWYARTIYNSPDKAHVKLEKKAIRNLLKDVGPLEGLNDIEKIVKIENYIKTEIELDKYSKVFYANDVLAKKVYSKTSSVRLFAHVLNQLGIEHELVLTSNRYKKEFDGDLESYTFLNHLFLYLPVEKVYLSPSSELHRVGTVPYGLTNQNGLVVKTIMVGSYVSAFPDVKFISSGDYATNTDNLDIKVELGSELNEVITQITRSTKGHCATGIRPYLPYVSEKQRENLLKEFFLEIALDSEVENITTKNEEMGGSQKDKPFIVSATVKLNSLIEKAGEKHLFHLGDLIGPQSELYQEKERKFNISNIYNRQYIREIELKIPKGYEVLNAQDFVVNDTLMVDSQVVAQFTCNYEVNGGSLYFVINEYYDRIEIDKKHYPTYRKVINSAADFNKKVLILTKE